MGSEPSIVTIKGHKYVKVTNVLLFFDATSVNAFTGAFGSGPADSAPFRCGHLRGASQVARIVRATAPEVDGPAPPAQPALGGRNREGRAAEGARGMRARSWRRSRGRKCRSTCAAVGSKLRGSCSLTTMADLGR